MTARNRLRKRAAQKATVTSSGVGSRNYHDTCKESRIKVNNSTSNDANVNKKAAGAEPSPNSINSTQTKLITNSSPTANVNTSGLCSSENCNIVLASTATTMNLKNNQIQTIVLSNTGSSELNSKTQVLLKNNQGEKILICREISVFYLYMVYRYYILSIYIFIVY